MSIICCDEYKPWPFTPEAVLLSVAARRCVFALVELTGRNAEVLSPPCSLPRHGYCVVSGLASCLCPVLVFPCFLCSQNNLALVLVCFSFFLFFLSMSLPVVQCLLLLLPVIMSELSFLLQSLPWVRQTWVQPCLMPSFSILPVSEWPSISTYLQLIDLPPAVVSLNSEDYPDLCAFGPFLHSEDWVLP